MSTVKQKRVARLIIENANLDKPLNKGQLVEMGGYSKTVADAKPQHIIDQQGVKEALRDFGFTEDNAKMVVSEIMLDSKRDPNARLKATDQVFKVHGSYKHEEEGNKTLIIQITPETANRYALTPSDTEGSSS